MPLVTRNALTGPPKDGSSRCRLTHRPTRANPIRARGDGARNSVARSSSSASVTLQALRRRVPRAGGGRRLRHATLSARRSHSDSPGWADVRGSVRGSSTVNDWRQSVHAVPATSSFAARKSGQLSVAVVPPLREETWRKNQRRSTNHGPPSSSRRSSPSRCPCRRAPSPARTSATASRRMSTRSPLLIKGPPNGQNN